MNTKKNKSENLTEELLSEIVEDGMEYFFSSVASHFPEIKTGDFTPTQQGRFEEACKEAVKSWVENNKPITGRELSELVGE